MLDLTRKWNEQTPARCRRFRVSNAIFPAETGQDGKTARHFYEQDGDESGIGIFDFETQTYEKVTETGASPFWLNDNRHFIYTFQNTVFLCDSQTGKITELYKPSAYELQHANISPDNKTIFFRYLQVDADVWLIDASTENQ